MRTFLFFPVEVGIAHIARSIAVAEELGNRGNRSIVALPKRKQKLCSKPVNVEIVDISPYVQEDFQIDVGSFTNRDFLNKIISQECDLIKKYKPDAVIVDFRLSALASSIIEGCDNIFFITNSDALPNAPYFPNPGFTNVVYSNGLPVVQKIFRLGMRNYLSPLLKICEDHKRKITYEAFLGMINFLIAEPKGYWLGKNNNLKLHYVSPISWNRFENLKPEWITKIYPDGKTIYLTFGGTGFDKDKLIQLAYALHKSGFRVIVSTGEICEPSEFEKLDNLIVVKYLSGKEISKRVDFVICHGGHGTMSEAIANGRPFLAIPFNPDQILHATRMQELGLGKCLVKLNLLDILRIFLFDWKRIENLGMVIPVSKIVLEAKILSGKLKMYDKNIRKYNKYPLSLNGRLKSADVIEKICSENNNSQFKSI